MKCLEKNRSRRYPMFGVGRRKSFWRKG
jgi:hypothetical protein